MMKPVWNVCLRMTRLSKTMNDRRKDDLKSDPVEYLKNLDIQMYEYAEKTLSLSPNLDERCRKTIKALEYLLDKDYTGG